MLKAIVEQKNVDGSLGFELAALREAVFADAEGYTILQARAHQFDFIAGVVCAAITTRENGNALPLGQESFSKPNHERRFASAADGYVADADDGGVEAFLF